MTKLSDDEFQKIVTDILRINNRLRDKTYLLKLSGDALSYLAIKLAAMKSLIIEVKADAHRDFLDAETEYKAVKARALRRLIGEKLNPEDEKSAKISATAAGDLLYAEEEVISAAHDKAEKEAFWNKLKSISADAHDDIDAIKSRVIDLQGARKDERVG